MNAKILIVEDDADMAGLIRLYLKKEGWEGHIAADGTAALALCRETSFDLVIMDVMMPGLDGFQTVAELRAFSRVPVIMLTARDGIMDKIRGFNSGTDDYMTKPYEPEELLLRVKALLRRSAMLGEITSGGLVVNPEQYTVTVGGVPVEMAPKEIELLALLMSGGQVFTREELLNRIWGGERGEGSRTLDVHVNRIREKLGEHGKKIKTVWNVGYRFEG